MSDVPATFEFTHPDLRRTGTEFILDDDRKVVLRMGFGELRGTFEVDKLAASLGLKPGDPDLRRVGLLRAALLYVRRVAHGDPVPTELAGGQPSWMPNAKLLDRATRTVARALQARLAALPGVPKQPEMDISALGVPEMARLMHHYMPDTGEADIARRLTGIVQDLGRMTWLLRSTSLLQRTVGELAQYSAARSGSPAGDLARQCALTLRTPTVWATERAMTGDAIVGDINRLIANQDLLQRRAWPLIGELRALIIDIDAVLRLWADYRTRQESLQATDMGLLLRKVMQRYMAFSPALFNHREYLKDGAVGPVQGWWADGQ